MVTPAQGDIWWAEAEDKRRPVLVVTRSEVIGILRWIIVAPVTRTIRGIPTEIRLDDREGLAVECVALFDQLQPIRTTFLTQRIGALGARRREICLASRALSDC